MLNQLNAYLEEERAGLRELSSQIWSHPEIGYHETFACKTATDFITAHGYDIVNPFCKLDTAFKSVYTHGNGGPTFAFCSEFDALAGLGHGCGHNLICAGGIAAFLATARFMKEHNVNGTVVLLGTPAEESYGGKVKMEEAGCLEGIDAVLMAHPGGSNTTDSGSSAVIGYEVIFHGKAAHGSSPQLGINALDAINLLFAAIGAYRQQMPDTSLIHGIITNGGAAPNIIPDTAACRIYLRSIEEELLPSLQERFLDMVKGAELMTRATAEINVFHPLYRACKPNQSMNEEYAKLMEEQGESVKTGLPVGRGSTDFGNFSQRIPGCHLHFAVVEPGAERVAGHSIEMREVCARDYGFERMLMSSAAMAAIAIRFMADPVFRHEVQKEFKA